MDNKQLKLIIENYLNQHRFIKKGPYYYVKNDEIICVIGLQKSKYSGGYYINVGYLIVELNPTLVHPADADCDIRTRFNFMSNGRVVDLFNSDNISSEIELMASLNNNIGLLITDRIDRLKQLIQNDPTLLYQTKLSARKYLKLDAT